EQAIAATEDHRGPEDRPAQAAGLHRRFGRAARAQVVAGAAPGIECAHLQQPRYTRALAGGNERLSELHVGAFEIAPAGATDAGLVEDADQVPDRVRARALRRQPVAVV